MDRMETKAGAKRRARDMDAKGRGEGVGVVGSILVMTVLGVFC
jgi:hypothetical protein